MVFCLLIFPIEYFIRDVIKINTTAMLIAIAKTGSLNVASKLLSYLYIKNDNPHPINMPQNKEFSCNKNAF